MPGDLLPKFFALMVLHLLDFLPSIQKGESCIYRGHGKMEYLCYSGQRDFLFKNVKLPLPYFEKILADYF